MNEKIKALNNRIRSKQYEIDSLKRSLMQVTDEFIVDCYIQSMNELEVEIDTMNYEIACIEANSNFSVEGLFQATDKLFQKEYIQYCVEL